MDVYYVFGLPLVYIFIPEITVIDRMVYHWAFLLSVKFPWSDYHFLYRVELDGEEILRPNVTKPHNIAYAHEGA